MALPLLAMAVGAGIGAGVGSYGHDNWGWSKDAIWQGAAVGTGGGYAYGAYGAPAGSSLSSQAGPPTALATGTGVGAANVAGGAGAGGAAAGGGSLFSAKSLATPLLLGAAGLGIASAYGTQGSAFMQPVSLSAEGKELEAANKKSIQARLKKAKSGDVGEKIFQETSALKKSEGARQRVTEGAIGTGQAIVGNRPKEQRGGGVMGGQFVKGVKSDMGERMTGLFAPTSLLNSFRKEELINASNQVWNQYKVDNQVASANYSSSLAKWGANQQLASEKGAAIGGAVAMLGQAYSSGAYLNQMKIAG